MWHDYQNDNYDKYMIVSKEILDKYWGDCCYSLDPSEFVLRNKSTANRSHWPNTKAEEEGKGKGKGIK